MKTQSCRWKMIVRGAALMGAAGVVLAAGGCESSPSGVSKDLVWISAPSYVISKARAGNMCGIVVEVSKKSRSLDEIWQSAYWCDSAVLEALHEGVYPPPMSSREMKARLVALGLPDTLDVRVFAAGLTERLTENIRVPASQSEVPRQPGEPRVQGVFIRLPGQVNGTAGLFMPFTTTGRGPQCEDILLFRSIEEGDSILKITRRIRFPLTADVKPYELDSWTEEMVKLHPPLEYPELPPDAKPE